LIGFNNKAQITVDMAGLQVSKDPSSILVTYALGSCIAIILYEPNLRVGGMLHYMLPLSKTSPEKAKTKPAMFGDTGIPLLFESMYKLGCTKGNLIVKVAGGAKLWDDKGTFDIGKRNYTVMRKLFWKNNVMVSSEDVGGSKSRTARLFLESGEVLIRSKGTDEPL
jgi:chemotaxis protein CheD